MTAPGRARLRVVPQVDTRARVATPLEATAYHSVDSSNSKLFPLSERKR
jgi:hypothetical protein